MDEIRKQLIQNKCLHTKLLDKYEKLMLENDDLKKKNNELSDALIETQKTIRDLLDGLKEESGKLYG